MIRATRIELIVPKERKPIWKELAEQCQQATNRLWQVWLCHHVANDSASKMQGYMDRYQSWKTDKIGDKPTCPVKPIDKELSGKLYHDLSQRYPALNSRTRGLLQNKWQQTVRTRKASRGSLSGWLSILFCRESIPSFQRPVPIPFDKQNGRLSSSGTGRYVLQVRIDRVATTNGKRPAGKSTFDECVMLLGKRKMWSVKLIVDRILSGEYNFKGSALCYDRGKWFALVSYEMPATSDVVLDADKVLHVWPAHRGPDKRRHEHPRDDLRRGPWLFKIAGQQPRFLGGDGKHVSRFRDLLTRGRFERQEHYRWAGSAQKGHGRQRAIAAWTKLGSRWKHFVKRYNHEITRRVLNIAMEHRCGQIVYHQPLNTRRERCFLTGRGNVGARTAWDYFQFGTLLASKCEQYGIKCEIRKREQVRDNGFDERGRDETNSDVVPVV
jgi:hypothetical protein